MKSLVGLIAGFVLMHAHAQEPVRLYAAGSLRAALDEVAAESKVEAVYGASGLLRERIAKGEPAEVFASANMEHPQSLEKAGRAGPVKRFALIAYAASLHRV